jgi:hypothetical protein
MQYLNSRVLSTGFCRHAKMPASPQNAVLRGKERVANSTRKTERAAVETKTTILLGPSHRVGFAVLQTGTLQRESTS